MQWLIQTFRWGGGGGKGGAGLKKIFRAFEPQLGGKWWGAGPPGPLPWICNWNGPGTHVITLFCPHVVCPYYSAPNLWLNWSVDTSEKKSGKASTKIEIKNKQKSKTQNMVRTVLFLLALEKFESIQFEQRSLRQFNSSSFTVFL